MTANSRSIVAAVCQMRSTGDVTANLERAEALLREAARAGARFIGLPECMVFLKSEGEPSPEAQTIEGPWANRFSTLARELGVTVLMGSFPEKATDGSTRVHNTTILFGDRGETLGVYRKIHLFDIDLPGMEHLKESKVTAAGNEIVVAGAPFGSVGLSICYDIRFPELYRELARRGAQVLCIPSAFTERTGRDHWEVLLRARAIENLAYVFAPAQWGEHGPRRRSYGHAMIVDPWGTIVAQVAEGDGFAIATLDFERVARLRSELPALAHCKL